MEAKVLGDPNKPWPRPYTQQGDCLIKKCGRHNVFSREFDKIPKDAESVSGNLVLKGQSNSHALFGGKFQLFRAEDHLFIRVEEPTVLDHVKDEKSRAHAEHHAQWIPVGEYFVPPVKEYDHIKEESRAVID